MSDDPEGPQGGANGDPHAGYPTPDADELDHPLYENPAEGPSDPQLDPTKSPGFGEDIEGLEDIEVSREDVTIGEATPEELAASDTDPVANETLAEHLDRLRHDDATERQRAAVALARAAAADPPMGKDDPAAVMATLGDDAGRVVLELARVVGSDEDGDVRQFACEALGKVASEGTDDPELVARAGAVVRAAIDDPDPWVRAEAVVALDRIDRDEHADAVDDALADDHHAVRRNALVSVFKREGEAALPALLDAADDDAARVREWVAYLLGGIDDDAARAALDRLAGDPSDIVRETADYAADVDPTRFRRSFAGSLEGGRPTLRGEDELNRRPDL